MQKGSSKETLVTKRDGASPLANVALEANDDECLKQRLDKVSFMNYPFPISDNDLLAFPFLDLVLLQSIV